MEATRFAQQHIPFFQQNAFRRKCFQTIRKNGINKEFRKYGTPDGRSAEAAVAIAVYPGKQIGSMPYLPLLFHVVACSGHGYGGYGVLQFRPLLRRAGKIKRV